MIVGLGTDIIAVERMRSAYARHGERLLLRILAEEERQELVTVADVPRFLAKRFAVKEAAAKALGRGLRGLSWQDVFLRHDALGRPLLAWSSRWHRQLLERQWQCWVSLSDERDYAIATVIIETGSSD